MPLNWLSRCLILGAALSLLLVAYGVYLIPATSLLSIAAAAAILLAYAAIGWFALPQVARRYPIPVRAAAWAGCGAALIFAAEIFLEYVFLPKNNAPWGLVEFGSVFLIYASVATWLVLARQTIRQAVLASFLSSIFASIVWCICVFAAFYVFYQTDRQHQVFQAEGNYDDFRGSGMSNFPKFIMEDFCGAAFFHLLLGPAVACLLGLGGGLAGKGIAWIVKLGQEGRRNHA